MIGITVTPEPNGLGSLLGFVNYGDTMFDTVDTKKGLYFMGFKKKNPKTKGYKNNDFS